MIKRARILLADDHGLIVAGIRSLLDPDYDIVGHVNDGRSLVESALRLRPDLTILDISMPQLNGIDASHQIKSTWPEVKLLFLTMHANPVYLREAMDVGAMGYVLKSSAFEELRTAVRRILKCQVYITPSFDRDVMENVHASIRGRPRPSATLTPRQAEILQLVAEGWGNKEIADVLAISVKTVEFHRGRIMGKLGAHNVADLVRYAVQSGKVGV
jgi:DNA-binding NarL/FixJ family response regulator